MLARGRQTWDYVAWSPKSTVGGAAIERDSVRPVVGGLEAAGQQPSRDRRRGDGSPRERTTVRSLFKKGPARAG